MATWCSSDIHILFELQLVLNTTDPFIFVRTSTRLQEWKCQRPPQSTADTWTPLSVGHAQPFPSSPSSRSHHLSSFLSPPANPARHLRRARSPCHPEGWTAASAENRAPCVCARNKNTTANSNSPAGYCTYRKWTMQVVLSQMDTHDEASWCTLLYSTQLPTIWFSLS